MQLNEWIRKNSRMFKAFLGDRIKLMTHLTPDLPDARACPRKLSQLMLSLVETAKDGMPDGGELTLASGLGHSCMESGVRAAGSCTNELTEDCVAGHVCRRASSALPAASPPPRELRSTVFLRISDTGRTCIRELAVGLNRPLLSATPTNAGAEVGVVTVAELAHHLGGRIEVDRFPAAGRSITLHLASADSTKDPEGHVMSPLQNPGESPLILFVDDADDIRGLAERLLTINGYQVLAASSGPEALKLAGSAGQAIDLLITDIEMPGMSGKTLAERLSEAQPGLRVLLVSGYTVDSEESQELNACTLEFLQKPFRPLVLLEKVQQMLRG